VLARLFILIDLAFFSCCASLWIHVIARWRIYRSCLCKWLGRFLPRNKLELRSIPTDMTSWRAMNTVSHCRGPFRHICTSSTRGKPVSASDTCEHRRPPGCSGGTLTHPIFRLELCCHVVLDFSVAICLQCSPSAQFTMYIFLFCNGAGYFCSRRISFCNNGDKPQLCRVLWLRDHVRSTRIHVQVISLYIRSLRLLMKAYLEVLSMFSWIVDLTLKHSLPRFLPTGVN
jgi:hypothetical protein